MKSFSQKVYRVVCAIPLGQVRSYKQVARLAGRPAAARAVGRILKKNPFPLIIPCHRVVKSNGALGGYAFGGEKKKKFILDLERKIKELML